MSKYNVAVVGATGAVGEVLLEILAERNFPIKELYPLASERSAGKTVMYKNKPVLVGNLAEFDFSKVRNDFITMKSMMRCKRFFRFSKPQKSHKLISYWFEQFIIFVFFCCCIFALKTFASHHPFLSG